MAEVFKTNVQAAFDAGKITASLLERFPLCRVSFDLEDCDKILRIAGNNVCVKEIRTVVAAHGFLCEELCD